MRKLEKTLYIRQPDSYLGLDGENVVIFRNDEKITQFPLHNIERIITFNYTGASPALMGKCARDGIYLTFLQPNGKFLARVEGRKNGNVLLRREQYRIADDPEKALSIAKNIICAKIFNSRWVLERTTRDHALRIDCEKFKRKSQFLKELIKKAEDASDIDSLRGIEGEAATIYFSVFDDMILQQKDDFVFEKRSHRPPLNRVNALLSFAYSLTTNLCVSGLESVGLDSYVGFMHTDRPARPSLALDLVEEFRAVFCDRFVLKLINKQLIKPEHFDMLESGAVYLSEKGKDIFIKEWDKREFEELTHPYLQEKIEWGLLPYVQALLLSRAVREDLDCYPPFLWK